MKTVIAKDYLKQGIEAAERVAVKSPSLPILQNILLSVEKGLAKISATDLQMGITYQCLGTTEETGAVAFPPRLLSSLLAFSAEEKVVLSHQGHALSVCMGHYEATIKTASAEEFPLIPSLQGEEVMVSVEAPVLCEGLSQVGGMVGQGQARPEISGVFFVFDKAEGRVVATDSFRLAERRFALQNQGVGGQSFILPAKPAREVVAVLSELPGTVLIYPSPTQVVFVYEAQENPSRVRVEIVSRIIEGEYPHYEEVIPSTHRTLVRTGKGVFLEHLRAAGVFAGKTQEVRLCADPEKKEISFRSENADAGSHHSFLAAEVEGEKGEAAFNWRFLTEGLASVKTDHIEFGLNGEDGPALLRPQGQGSADREGYLYVVMPIKA